MEPINKIKALLYKHLLEVLESKIADAKSAIASAKESRDNDTKSSAGDKYETGRAMMQQEMDKNELQLSTAMKQLQDLSKLDLHKHYSKVENGSMVITDDGKYFISIGAGKIPVNDEIYYAISAASPVGMLLQNKTAGEDVQFQGRRFTILEIY